MGEKRGFPINTQVQTYIKSEKSQQWKGNLGNKISNYNKILRNC